MKKLLLVAGVPSVLLVGLLFMVSSTGRAPMSEPMAKKGAPAATEELAQSRDESGRFAQPGAAMAYKPQPSKPKPAKKPVSLAVKSEPAPAKLRIDGQGVGGDYFESPSLNGLKGKEEKKRSRRRPKKKKKRGKVTGHSRAGYVDDLLADEGALVADGTIAEKIEVTAMAMPAPRAAPTMDPVPEPELVDSPMDARRLEPPKPVLLGERDKNEAEPEETEEEAPDQDVKARGPESETTIVGGQHRIAHCAKGPPLPGGGEGEVKPATFMPRVCYFENTYLGGSAAHEHTRRRMAETFGQQPFSELYLPQQAFDPPGGAGLALSATLDRRHLDKPGRVFLQIGLQGSKRYGWRRPPLDLVLVIDQPAANTRANLRKAVLALASKLGPQDRLGVLLVAPGRPVSLAEVGDARARRLSMERSIAKIPRPAAASPADLRAAMLEAGDMLRSAAGEEARVPGTQTVVLLSRGQDAQRVEHARQAAHRLTVQGAVTSVIELEGRGVWWPVANAGHGNDHRATTETIAQAVEAELDSLSRVIARLLRINVRLANHVEGVRVIGSRVLGQREVKQVKAREEATDHNLSKTLGVEADRGEDDDGIQTVIPYFYGGDSHVILVELWVDKPGAVAEISLKYKDMVELGNATARTSVHLGARPRPLTRAHELVRKNLLDFDRAALLERAAVEIENNRYPGALARLREAEAEAPRAERAAYQALIQLTNQRRGSADLSAAIRMASKQRIGLSANARRLRAAR